MTLRVSTGLSPDSSSHPLAKLRQSRAAARRASFTRLETTADLLPNDRLMIAAMLPKLMRAPPDRPRCEEEGHRQASACDRRVNLATL